MNHTVEVSPYDPHWPQMFESEAKLIREALGNNCLKVHHIGSTSIPHLAAKPIIDILPVVKNILEVDEATNAMERLGYEVKGEYGIAFRRFFQKGIEISTHNVHVFEDGDPEINRYLKFRDWMRSHDDDAQAYAKLKLKLAEKFPDDILKYCQGKDAFVANIDAIDGYNGWRMVKALTDREWAAVRSLRKNNFFKSKPDPFTWTFEHKDHLHWVFYKNADIIGYAHIQLWSKNEAIIRVIVIDKKHRNLGLRGQFLKLCERWLSHQGVEKLHLKSSPPSYKFFTTHGYLKMPFNGPDSYEIHLNEVQMGKTLLSKP